MVRGAGAAHESFGLVRETGAQIGPQRPVEVLFHVAQRNRRPRRELARQAARARPQRVVRDQLVEQTQREALIGRDATAGQVDRARTRRTDELGQEPAAAVVTRQPDVGEPRNQERRTRGDTQVTGQRERHAGAGRGSGQRGNGRLGQLEQAQRQRLLPVLQLAHRVLQRGLLRGTAGTEPAAHSGHVATGAERASRAGQDDHADIARGFELEQNPTQSGGQRIRQRVAFMRAVERYGRDPIRDLAEEFVGAGVQRARRHVFRPAARAGADCDAPASSQQTQSRSSFSI